MMQASSRLASAVISRACCEADPLGVGRADLGDDVDLAVTGEAQLQRLAGTGCCERPRAVRGGRAGAVPVVEVRLEHQFGERSSDSISQEAVYGFEAMTTLRVRMDEAP